MIFPIRLLQINFHNESTVIYAHLSGLWLDNAEVDVDHKILGVWHLETNHQDILEQLRTAMETSAAMFDKEKAQERLSKLSGGVAVFRVWPLLL